jgi:cytochrome c-type biogenesis protein CcmH/NrfF
MPSLYIPVARLHLLTAIFAGMLLLLGAGDNSARVDRLGHQMMCVCSCNQILLECNHVGCSYSTRMRDELVAAVDRGETDNGVLQWFIQNYGTTVLTVPTNRGFNRIAWIMPYLALVVGISLVVFIVGVWRKRTLVKPSGLPSAIQSAELDRFREQARRETGL